MGEILRGGHWPPANNPSLVVENAMKNYKGVHALAGVSLHVDYHETLGLIGPNGSGKSTLVNCICGVTPLSSGSVLLNGTNISTFPRTRRAQMGIARTFQNLRIFPELTAFENVMIGSTSVRLASRTKRDEAIQLLGQLGLGDMVRTRTGDLPYGYQRRVEIARALAARPSLLCLDEPAAGLNDNETAELQEILRQVHMEFNCSIILIDHDMTLVLGLAHRVIVLDEGHVIYEGAPEKVFHQQNVVDAYLGST